MSAHSAISVGQGVKLAQHATYQQRAIAVLQHVSEILGTRDAIREFRVRRIQSDHLGFHHVRVEQRHAGVRVVGAELIVHFDNHDRAYEVNGRYIPGISLTPTPQISAEDAADSATTDLRRRALPEGELREEPELVVYARHSPN
ncbi:MAG: hypothetical protein M5U15_05510 [Kiritimatiellae bacterium]|nr:hypothetical protein [Kiritimatiellia bacterium]